jgi:hypothetical protein
MVSKMEEYTSSWSNVFHSVPGEEENTVLSGGAKIKSKISAASTIKTMLMLSGFLQLDNLGMISPLGRYFAGGKIEMAPKKIRRHRIIAKVHIPSFPNTGGMDVSTHTLETLVYRLPTMGYPLGAATRRVLIFSFRSIISGT